LSVTLDYVDDSLIKQQEGHHGQSRVVRSSGSKAWERKRGREFLLAGLPLVQAEPATTAWFGIRLGPSTFGIFDAFPNEVGRQAHLTGQVAAALMAKAADLFAKPPSIEKVDVSRGKATRLSGHNRGSAVAATG